MLISVGATINSHFDSPSGTTDYSLLEDFVSPTSDMEESASKTEYSAEEDAFRMMDQHWTEWLPIQRMFQAKVKGDLMEELSKLSESEGPAISDDCTDQPVIARLTVENISILEHSESPITAKTTGSRIVQEQSSNAPELASGSRSRTQETDRKSNTGAIPISETSFGIKDCTYRPGMGELESSQLSDSINLSPESMYGDSGYSSTNCGIYIGPRNIGQGRFFVPETSPFIFPSGGSIIASEEYLDEAPLSLRFSDGTRTPCGSEIADDIALDGTADVLNTWNYS